jgi:hypothetical protein
MDIAVEGIEQAALLQERQESDEDAGFVPALAGVPSYRWRQLEGAQWHDPVTIDVLMRGEVKLFEVIRILRAANGLSGCLNRREQQGNQDADDGNHHQQLDEREATS